MWKKWRQIKLWDAAERSPNCSFTSSCQMSWLTRTLEKKKVLFIISKWRREEWKRKEKTSFQNVLAICNAFPPSPSCPSFFFFFCLCASVNSFWLPTWQETAVFFDNTTNTIFCWLQCCSRCCPFCKYERRAVDHRWQWRARNAYRPIQPVWFALMLDPPINVLRRVTVELVHFYLDITGSPFCIPTATRKAAYKL